MISDDDDFPYPGAGEARQRRPAALPSYPHDPNPDNWDIPGVPPMPNSETHPDAYQAWARRYGSYNT